MAKKYKYKNETVEAVKWTGKNAPEMVLFAGDLSEWDGLLTLEVGGTDRVAHKGDYIVKIGGEPFVFKPDEFKKMFQEVRG